jgi:PIN domain nuclease of toxin-antitoxin system
VRLLLDTHTLLWTLDDDARLRRQARDAIVDPENEVLASAASAWEIAVKSALGKIRPLPGLGDALREQRFAELPVSIDHALCVAELPLHHRDPFDRLLVAQAQLEGLTIVTRDERIARYGVATLRA